MKKTITFFTILISIITIQAQEQINLLTYSGYKFFQFR